MDVVKLFERALIIFGLASLLAVIGTVGFHLIEGWSWFQSFYCTLMTVSTIGAEPENQLSNAGRAFNVGVVILGVGVVGFAIGTFTQAVIEFELGSFVGRRRMSKEISELQNHYIICGAGRVGRRVAMEMNARGLPFVIVEADRSAAEWVKEAGFLLIEGDATNEQVLEQAQIRRAAGLASAVTSDAQNVYIVLTARGMAPHLPIVARASEEAAESKLLKAGANRVISPYHYAGQRMARVLTRPNVESFIDLAMSSLSDGSLNLQIEEVRVVNGSRLVDSTLAEADLRHSLGVKVLAIRHDDGNVDFNPGGAGKISAGDFLIVMGETQKLKAFESLAGV
jgi:voltage-gated potassium channel